MYILVENECISPAVWINSMNLYLILRLPLQNTNPPGFGVFGPPLIKYSIPILLFGPPPRLLGTVEYWFHKLHDSFFGPRFVNLLIIPLIFRHSRLYWTVDYRKQFPVVKNTNTLEEGFSSKDSNTIDQEGTWNMGNTKADFIQIKADIVQIWVELVKGILSLVLDCVRFWQKFSLNNQQAIL